MKSGKKILALVLAVLLALAALTGCGKKAAPAPEPEIVTAASLLRDMNDRMREQGSASADVQASLSFSLQA